MKPGQYAHPPASAPAGLRAPGARTAIGLLLWLIVYGSLYPLRWNFDQPQDFIFFGPVGLVDLVENIVLFAPLGGMLAWHYHGQPRQGRKFVAWFLLALLVATALQWLQKYLPRTPALSDIVFNMAGHVAGWWTGAACAHRVRQALQRHSNLHAADRFALLMLAIWLLAELFPLIPTFDVSSVASNVKSLWLQDAWQPRRMLRHAGMTVIGLEALACLIRSVSARHLVRILAGIATAGLVAGKFVVVGQAPGMAGIAGILAGALLWWGIDHGGPSLRPKILLALAAGTYLLYAIWPLQWRAVAEPMRWLPFSSALAGTPAALVPVLAFESLCLGAIIWSAVRAGAAPGKATLATAALAFACEWMQRYLPTRTPEITSLLLALCMGWLAAAFGMRHRRLHA